MTRFGRKLGVSHEQIESIGRLFSRTHRDEVFIFIVRFLPVLPSAPISATAGIFKLPLKGYLIASFLGTAMRNSMYLLLGYFGIGVVKDFVDGVERTEVYLQAGMLVFLAGIILWAIRQRTNKDFLQKLLARLMGRKRKETR
jgi:membrane protein DedA with SNARE-associated domain